MKPASNNIDHNQSNNKKKRKNAVGEIFLKENRKEFFSKKTGGNAFKKNRVFSIKKQEKRKTTFFLQTHFVH